MSGPSRPSTSAYWLLDERTSVRVAIIGAYSLQDNRISGGPEAVVVQLADGLRRLPGMDVHIFTASSRVVGDSVQQRDGVTVHRLRLRRVPRWTLVRANARALGQAVRRIAPDVAHAHSGGTWGDAALSSGAPTVITVHGVIRQEAQIFRRDLATEFELALRGVVRAAQPGPRRRRDRHQPLRGRFLP